MKLRRTKIGLLVGLATLAGACLPADAARLQQVRVNPLMAGQTAIEFEFDGSVSYTDVLKYRPNYLLVNVADSQSDFSKDKIDINNGAIKDVNIGTSGTDLQLKVGLKDLVPYKIAQNGNSVVVTLGQDGKSITAKANANVSGATINSINNVDFRKNGTDEGLVVIGLDNNSAAVDVSQRGNSVRVKFNATGVNADQLQTYDVTDFGTPVKSMHVSKQGNTAIVDVAFNGKVDYRTEQDGNKLVLKVSKKKEVKKDMPKYNGKPISLNFQDVPVRTVLQLIADFNNFNLVTTDTVRGNITIRLDSVPWEQALETILRIKGLDKRLDGNILLVAQAKELADLEEQKLQGQKKVEELAPLVTEYVQVNYAKATEIAKLLAATGGSDGAANRILSNRGSVSVDQRTNTLIVKDTAETLDKIQDLVKKLDVPIKQVTIEARIVTVDDTVTDELGVNWSLSKSNAASAGDMSSTFNPGGQSSGKSMPGAYNSTLNPYGVKSGEELVIPLEGVNHGHWMTQTAFDTVSTGIGLSIGKIWDNILVDMYLSALETENKAEVISSPRVTTADQQEALIEQGVDIPTEVSTSSGSTSTEWKKAVLSLKVTPQITPDNRIILDLVVTQDTMGEEVATGNGRARSINTQRVETQVLVENGETIVLGGIYQQEITKRVSKVPLLGDIPYLGALFRYTNNANRKRELLVFVTPKIVIDKQ
ncbi:MAG: type IV pilus secretin PilQ [Succinivibrionaceae bacterium]|nr:type IV pilus secretin PilQ [Succinivibrionaceae bacterium]